MLSSGRSGREEVGGGAAILTRDKLWRIDPQADVTAPRWRRLRVGCETARPGGNGPASPWDFVPLVCKGPCCSAGVPAQPKKRERRQAEQQEHSPLSPESRCLLTRRYPSLVRMFQRSFGAFCGCDWLTIQPVDNIPLHLAKRANYKEKIGAFRSFAILKSRKVELWNYI